MLRNKQLDGIGLYCINLFKEVISQNSNVHFQLLLPSNFVEDYFNFPNVTKYKIFPPFRHPVLYIFWLEIILPIFLKFIKSDIFIGADGMLSLLSSQKQIPIIYDLNFHHFPNVLDFKNRLFYNSFFPLYIKKAHRIVTISDFCKNDIIKSYNIELTKISVIYGDSNIQRIKLTPIEKEVVRKEFSMGCQYFFFVGSLLPRKNIKNLILAFQEFKNNSNSDVKLLISGNKLWGTDEIMTLIENFKYKKDIVFLGRLSDNELQLVLASSLSLCYVSLFEGFGIPILEAMKCEVPVITSNVTSMPEISGGAAILVDPMDIVSISSAMNLIFENKDNLREDLILKGIERTKYYSWKKSAELLWRIVTSH